MNIVIQYHNPCPFLSAIANMFSAIQHKTIFWNPQQQTVYEMVQQYKPDLLFVQNTLSSKNWEVIKDIPYIMYGSDDPQNKALAKIAPFQNNQEGFVDILGYKKDFADDVFETDILFSSNYLDVTPASILLAMDKVYDETDFSLKCTGAFPLPSVFFVGQTNNTEFIQLAGAAKLVVASNPIEKESLIYNKIYSCLLSELNPSVFPMIKEEKLRRKKVKERRQKLINSNKTSAHVAINLLNTINKPEEAKKITQILGQIL